MNFHISDVKKSFFRDLGILLHVPAFLLLPTLIVIFYFGETFALPSFIGMGLVSLLAGQLLYRRYKKYDKSLPRQTLIMVALAWFLVPLLGSIPFYLIGNLDPALVGDATRFSKFPSAFFESMSGLTSTGLSMLEHPETIPHSLQWWRSINEWLGGLGIILLVVGFFDFSSKTNSLYQAEAMNWTLGEGKLEQTIHKIWMIYLILTLVTIAVFFFLGMPLWEAINHGLTAISTGGFTITPDSFISYAPSIKIFAAVIMVVAAISFQVHYLLFLKRELRSVFKLSEFKLFLGILVLMMILTAVINPGTTIIDNVFQTASAFGTCGFNSVETPQMPVPVLFLFIVAMNLGGNATSTTGGLKTRRLLWMLKGISKSIKDAGKQEEDKSSIIINGKEIKDEEAIEQIRNAATIIIIWITALTLGTFLILLSEGEGHSFYQVVFDVSSALNNVGLSAGVNGDEMNSFSKFVFIVLMWIGRLEIFACLILIYSFFKSRLPLF
jgi:trk system potassium uptake protein